MTLTVFWCGPCVAMPSSTKNPDLGRIEQAIAVEVANATHFRWIERGEEVSEGLPGVLLSSTTVTLDSGRAAAFATW